MTTDERQKLNSQRVQKIHVLLRPNILAILADLEAAGWQPIIDIGVYRTPAEQAQKVAEGVSTVYYSYHNVTDPGGVPAAEAADIVDVRYQWSPPREYWLQLAGAAENQGLETGIYWGLSKASRSAIHSAIAKRAWDTIVELGWDTAHVQPPQSKFTISEAKNGYRYNPGSIRPNILSAPAASKTTKYKLLATDGHVMDVLNVYDGTAYVEARKWGVWMGVGVGFDNGKVLLQGEKIDATKVLENVGYIPIRSAAANTGLSVIVDNTNHSITLKKD